MNKRLRQLLKIVQKRKLFVSCGSDYHGPTKPKYHMGVSNCPEKALALVRILTKVRKINLLKICFIAYNRAVNKQRKEEYLYCIL